MFCSSSAAFQHGRCRENVYNGGQHQIVAELGLPFVIAVTGFGCPSGHIKATFRADPGLPFDLNSVSAELCGGTGCPYQMDKTHALAPPTCAARFDKLEDGVFLCECRRCPPIQLKKGPVYLDKNFNAISEQNF